MFCPSLKKVLFVRWRQHESTQGQFQPQMGATNDQTHQRLYDKHQHNWDVERNADTTKPAQQRVFE